MQKAKVVLIHDDGVCADGTSSNTLENGRCRICGFSPDVQSTAIIFRCPLCDIELAEDGQCATCTKYFERAV